MTPRHAPDAVGMLAVEVAAYGTLLDLLRVEQKALLAADAAAVQASLTGKARQVDLLRNLASERSGALRDAGLTSDAAGITAWLAAAADAPRGRALWTELNRLATEARTQNALNGRLIHSQQRHWDRALAALWQAGGAPTTYGADGRTQCAGASRALAAI